MKITGINDLIEQQCPSDHVLRNRDNQEYRNAFIEAFIGTHSQLSDSDLKRVFCHKFSNADSGQFDYSAYLRSACELSVANHVRLSCVSNFVTEKKVSERNQSDVDVYYTANHVNVRLEVKCATEDHSPTNPDRFIMKTIGRIPNRHETLADLNAQLAASGQSASIIEGKNKDQSLKDFLLSAANKFPICDKCGIESLNVLFVGCDYYDNIGRWRSYLIDHGGLFTEESFHPRSTFDNVDVVILSNLKYRHRLVRLPSDWTLENTFILPFINPKTGRNLIPSTVSAGLTIFDHHLKQFTAHIPNTKDVNVPDFVMDGIKVEDYIVHGISKEVRTQLFPIRPENFSVEDEDKL